MRRSSFFPVSLAGVLVIAASLSLLILRSQSRANQGPAAAVSPSRLPSNDVSARAARIPLRFEPNAGQAAADVKYIVRGPRYTLFLTATDAVMHVAVPKVGASSAHSVPAKEGVRAASEVSAVATVRLHLDGANPASAIVPSGKQPGVSHYYIGNDPSKWHTNISNYSELTYSGVYPGVNLVYHGNQGNLEHDFVINPGSDPSVIAMDVSGARGIEKDSTGNVILHTIAGQLRLDKPIAYQGEGNRRTIVAATYQVTGNRLSFALGSYDPHRPLVIDPTLNYSTYLGGTLWDQANGITSDSSGNIIIVGFTESADFPVTTGSYGGVEDAFVTKLSSNGSTLIYSVYLGGNQLDAAVAVAADSVGDAYVTGDTRSANFPTTRGVFQNKLPGFRNAFVTKFDPTGLIVYSTYYGGSLVEDGNGIAVDSLGDAIIGGQTQSSNLPLMNPAQPTFGGKSDGFIASLNPTGTALNYATYIGGSDIDAGFGTAVDPSGNAYLVGRTISTDFPVTAGAAQTTYGGNGDGFVVKFTPTGTITYATYLGGGAGEAAIGVAADSVGHAYVTGYTWSHNFPTKGALQPTNAGGKDAFLSEFKPDGNGAVFSTYLGGTKNDTGESVVVNSSGVIFLAGCTLSPDFPTVDPTQPTFGGGAMFGDAFFAQIAPLGASLVFSTYQGGSGDDAAYGITLDISGNAWIAGVTDSTDFPVTTNAYQSANAGSYDAFVAEYAQ
jgi:hypothetical protein